jgi:hypothetical protein
MTERVNRPYKKTGRKLKPLPATIEQIETLAGLGLTIEEICIFLKITKKTLYKRMVDCPEVGEAVECGRVRANAEVSKSLFRRIQQGDTTAIIWYQKNREPQKYRDRHELEHSGGLKFDGKLTLEIVDTDADGKKKPAK